jgi:ribosomal-protein-alanine N-acetyltransferase
LTIAEREYLSEEDWLLARPYRGKGLAVEAAKAVQEYGFEKQNFSIIIAIIDWSNLASPKLAGKPGMIFDRALDCGYKTAGFYRIDRAEFFRRKATKH